MFSGFWRRLRNPWVAIGACLMAIVLVGLGLFLFQVRSYIQSIRSGQPPSLELNQHQLVVKRLFAQPLISNMERAHVSSKGKDPILGNPNAKLKIVEFLDYQCPFCARSAPAIRAFVARHPHDVSVTLRDFPLESLHPLAFQASVAARCVFLQNDDKAFWLYHDLLFAQQDHATLQDLHDNAVRVGIDGTVFDRCVATRVPEQAIRASMQDGAQLQIEGTPTFFINDHRIPGALDLDMLEEIYLQLMKNL